MTIAPDQTRVFEGAAQPPPDGSTDFSLDRWDEWRDRVVQPQHRSELGASVSGRLEFLAGAALLGLRFDPDADPLTPGVLKPQQLLISDLMDGAEAAGDDSLVFEIVRRATKTTTIAAKLFGRCAKRAGYQVVFMAQSGVAGSRRLREWKNTLDRVTPEDTSIPPWLRGKVKPRSRAQLRAVALFGDDLLPAGDVDAEPEHYGREFRILAGEVGKGIYWTNGSTFLVMKPDGSAVRGEAADVTWLDEAQEVDPDDAAELLGALLPLMDTKPGAAFVVSGTAGPARLGPLWDLLQRLRAGEPGVAGCDYTAGQYDVDAEPIDWALIEDWDEALKLLLRVHPGIGTLTTVAKMRRNWEKMPRPQWAREYLSIWPRVAGARAIPSGWWDATATPTHDPRPARVAFGLDIKPGGEVATIAAAWRDDDGTAHVELVDHQLGTGWIPDRLAALSRAYPGCDISYDDIAEGRATVAETVNRRPKPRLRVQTYRDHAAGCIQLLRDLERGTIRHPRQSGLDTAVRVASRRELRGESRGVWLWAVGPEGGDISPLVAVTRALRAWDMHYQQAPRRRRVVTAS